MTPFVRRWLALYAGLLLLHLLLWREWSLLPDGKTHASILDVGQGDAILLVSRSGKRILVDGGTGDRTLEELSKRVPFFDRRIDLLVLTHPNTDHLTAFPEILRRYEVGHVLLTGVDSPLPLYQEFLRELADEQTTVLLPDPKTDIDFGDGLLLDVIWPDGSLLGKSIPEKEVNDTSLVLRAMSGDRSILLTGDMGNRGENAILASGADVRASILKVPHHGSKMSSSTGFLIAVRPALAVVSAGRRNRYGHPHGDILGRYHSFGIPVRMTSAEGTVSIDL